MFRALELRELHCFLNRCGLLKLCSLPFFGQAQHLTNFGRTKPPSGPKGKKPVACGAEKNKALLPFEALEFLLITWQSLNLKRDS